MEEGKFVNQYVTQDQIKEAVKISLEMAKDAKLEAKERGLALNRVFRSYHNNVSDRHSEVLLERMEGIENSLDERTAKVDKAIDNVKRLSKRNRQPWEDEDDDEQE